MTKIELELEEVPDDIKEKLPVILFGPITDINSTSILAEINSTYPGKLFPIKKNH